MARRWQGWPDELEWESLEYEFGLRCTRDRFGHIRIGVRLGVRLRSWDFAGEAQAAIMAEAGQLDRLAREAAAFFGQPTGVGNEATWWAMRTSHRIGGAKKGTHLFSEDKTE